MVEVENKAADKVFFLAFRFLEQEPAAAARILENQGLDDVAVFMTNTPAALAAAVIVQMTPGFAARLIAASTVLEKGLSVLWLRDMRNADAVGILRCAEKSIQQKLLDSFPLKKRHACELLLSYRADMVGAWVESDVPVFPADLSIAECLKRFKRHTFKESRMVIVVDQNKQVVGEASINDILRAAPNLSIDNLMHAPRETVSGRALLRSALRHTIWQQRDWAAIVNQSREFIGVLWYSHLREVLSNHPDVSLSSDHSMSLAVEVLQAHGESMRGLIDVLRKGIF